MDRIHLAKVGFLNPILGGLREAGAPPGTLARTAGLDRFDLTDPEAYIPVNRQHAFFDVLSKREGIAVIAAQFHERFLLGNIGDWGPSGAGRTAPRPRTGHASWREMTLVA